MSVLFIARKRQKWRFRLHISDLFRTFAPYFVTMLSYYILNDPAQRADWERRYASYRKHYRASSSARYYSTLRGFIIATLNAELKGES